MLIDPLPRYLLDALPFTINTLKIRYQMAGSHDAYIKLLVQYVESFHSAIHKGNLAIRAPSKR